MATTNIQQYYRKAYQDFSAGINDFENPLIIKENQFATLDNALINYTGLLERAQGGALDSSVFPNVSSNFIRMMVNFKRGTSVDNLVVAASDSANTNATYKVDVKQTIGDGTYSYIGYTTGTATFTNGSTTVTGSGTAWNTQLKTGDKIKPNATSTWYEIQTVGSATSITLTSSFAETTQSAAAYMGRIILNNSFIPQAVTFNNQLIITNGSETPFTWDNSTTALITNANTPKAKFIETHKNRVFMANTSGGPSTVYWSSALDATTWSNLSVEQVYPQDNGNIVCIKSFADSIIVFKDQGRIYQIIGNFDQDVNGYPTYIRSIDVPDNLGTIAGYSVVIHDDGRLYFLCQTGIYAMDQRLQFEKMSWPINNDVASILLSPGVTSNKSYLFNSSSTWNGGTYDACEGPSTLNSYFDYYKLVDATQKAGGVSVSIDSNKDVHIAYISASNPNSVVYRKWLASDKSFSINETVVTASNPIRNVAIDLNSLGVPGIAYGTLNSDLLTWSLYFTERTSGVWITSQTVDPGRTSAPAGSNLTNAYGLTFKYRSDDDPIVVYPGIANSSWAGGSYRDAHIVYAKRTGSTWAVYSTTVTGDGTIAYGDIRHVSLALASDTVFAVAFSSGSDFSFPNNNSTSGVVLCSATVGGYLSFAESQFPTFYNNNYVVSCYIDIDGNYNYVYGDNGVIKNRKNGSATTTLDSGSTSSVLIGHSLDSRHGNTVYSTSLVSSKRDERFIFQKNYNVGTVTFTNGSTALTGVSTLWSTNLKAGDKIRNSADTDAKYGTILTVNSDTSITLTANYSGASGSSVAYVTQIQTSINNTIDTANLSSIPGNKSFISTGNLFASVSFGADANSIIVRRVGFVATWLSPVENDSTLTKWGTLSAANEITAGGLIRYSIAINSTSTLPVPSAITNNTVISSDATKIYAQVTVTFVLGSFAKPSIDSLALNYTGTGVGAILPTGYVFNNEIYFTCVFDGASTNDTLLFLDRNGAWGTRSAYSLTFLCRYKGILYGGSSTNGNVYKLNSGYQFNGANYTTQAVTKEDLLGSLELQKEIYKVYVTYKIQGSGTFNFSYRLDNYKTTGGSSWNTQSVDQTANGIVEISGLSGQLFNSIQFKIDCSSPGVNMGIIGFVIVYGYVGLR